MLEELMPLHVQRAPAPWRGHVAAPGSGPAGEKCGTCDHIRRLTLSKTFFKCRLSKWTASVKTDVKFRDQACSKWREKGDRDGK
jgi:hypothetical protein